MLGCAKQEERDSKSKIFFHKLDVKQSKIRFSNNIIENDTLNYFSFPYLYLGGGVSVGDINNDNLPDIYFTGNMSPNKLYLNKGNLEFEDITQNAGVAGDERWYSGTTMVDVNSDGFLDIYVSVSAVFGKSANQLYINNGDNTFTEKAESYGIADKGTSIQSTFFDYDNDGFLDLFVANYPIVPVSQGNWYYDDMMIANSFDHSGHLYKNNGDESFTDVTFSSGVQKFGLTLGLVASDFNNDGFKDLYLSNDFNVPDYIYQNNGDGTFSEISQKATNHTSMFGMGVDAADFNNDGLSDVLQVDMTAEDHKRSKTNMASMSPETFYEAIDLGFNYQYMQNSLQLNNGPNVDSIPIFSDISRFAGMSTTDWSWGGLFADFDNDGLKDVFITNGVKRDVNNNDVNAKYNASNNPFAEQVEKDYRLMPSTPVSNYAFKNMGDFAFSKVTEQWGLDEKGFSNGFAYSDLDNDGDLDLIINNIDAPASVYINEAQKNENSYLKVKLKGPKSNFSGIGAKVVVRTNDIQQSQELTLTRGYQSSMDPILHFGIGKTTMVDELKVLWPNGSQQTLKNVDSNRLFELRFEDAVPQQDNIPSKRRRFQDITVSSGINFVHKEDLYDDFVFEPLLPHRNSRLGPALTVGDVNGDGLDDFFVGNATKSAGAMYVQNRKGQFTIFNGPWEDDALYEDTGAFLLDADGDSDLDLYVVNGGNHKLLPENHYQDRIYMNTKNGFVKSDKTLPKISASGSKVVAGDYDSDGDLDLFVGGRIIPGKYPYPSESYILRNDGGKDTALKYTNVTQQVAPELQKAGLVTSALWNDFDTDGKLDLILTGEWMPIRFFRNTGAFFVEETKDLGFSDKTGWWYSLQNLDLDADGDIDYLAGNLGLNYKYHASEKEPFEVYANDFDENGTTDIVLSYEKQGTKLPLRGRECSSQQVPAIKKRFETFESFANADLTDIYGQKMLEESLHYKANDFASHWIENKGAGKYQMNELPHQAQFSSINKFEIFDYNGDEYPDILMVGNLYDSEIETPRNDASIGLVLEGAKNGDLRVVVPQESGLFVKGEINDIVSIRIGKEGKRAFLVGANDEKLKLITLQDE